MRIICELLSQTFSRIATQEMDSEYFGIVSDNRFPLSHFLSGVVFDDHTKLTYISVPKEDSCPA